MFVRLFSRPFFVAGMLWLILLATFYLLADYLIMPSLAGQFKKTVPVPVLVGLSPTAAQKQLEPLGLKGMLDSTGDYSQDIPAGHILSQFPVSGTVVKQGRRIWIKISKGFKAVEVPQLRGMSLRQAEINLQQNGLQVGVVSELVHNNIPAGAVIGTTPPAGSKVEIRRSVGIQISVGEVRAPSTMPALRGMSFSQAKSRLEKLSLTLGEVIYRKEARSLPNSVLEQSPAPGTALKGQAVDLTLSK
jgi:beta-lactam-binding protein with PASTA domain